MDLRVRFSRGASCATTRAEAPLVGLVECGGRDKECSAACCTSALDGPNSGAIWAHDKRLAFADSLGSRCVARPARLNQIFRTVVHRIAVQMVGNHGIFGIARPADLPCDAHSAPVAGVSACANFVEQHCPCCRNKPSRARQRVPRQVRNAPVLALAGFYGRVAALPRAEPTYQARWPRVGGAAMFAGVFHLPIL